MTQEPFGDIPLFREIQRILASSEGPINLEIARQVGMAVAGQDPEPPPRDDAQARLDASIRSAELLLSGFTRLALDEPMRSRVVDRSWWVRSSLEGWRWLLEGMATRLTGEFERLGEGGGANPMASALGQVGPLLVGMQAGTLVGHLSRSSLARYDLPLPRDDDGYLFFVDPNIQKLMKDYDFEPETFTSWLAVHETARHLLVTSVPWLSRYLKSLLTEVIDAVELDTSDLERRLIELQSKGVEALQEGMGGDGGLPLLQTERHRRALDRVHSALALFEGYASYSAKAIMDEVAPDTARIEEGMARHKLAGTEAEGMLTSILGISLNRSLEAAGSTFCAAVVKLKGLPSLNRVWEAADNLPTIEEIKDPFAWMERVLTP